MKNANTLRSFVRACLVVVCASGSLASPFVWRQASEKELRGVIPARAPVERERIETEFRTASGVTDGRGKFIAGVVMITAGYAAEGKYSHFFITRVPIQIEEIQLPAGEYVFGFKRVDDGLAVKFYEAASGKLIGEAKAIKDTRRGPVRSLLINPPVNGKATIQIGRFLLEYRLSD
ncbi:MAG TPA: hypothetical protein VNN73_09220 [Blastocatellia bacterium]|nr:hypothetical protein [Blastocatellia bacterium]